MTKEAKTARQACKETYFLGSHLPSTARMRVLAPGMNGMSQKYSVILSLHQAEILALNRLFLTKDEENDGQPDGRLRSRYCDDKEDNHLPVKRTRRLSQSDESEVSRIEHDLYSHELCDEVSLDKEGDDSKGEEKQAQDKKVRKGDHSFSLFFTRTMAPTRAAIIRTEVISKG